MLETLRT
jgi:hypothetical protein